jgi:hypothetical protein
MKTAIENPFTIRATLFSYTFGRAYLPGEEALWVSSNI